MISSVILILVFVAACVYMFADTQHVTSCSFNSYSQPSQGMCKVRSEDLPMFHA